MSTKQSKSSYDRALANAAAIGEAVRSVLGQEVVLIIGIEDGRMNVKVFARDEEAAALGENAARRIARALGGEDA